MGMWRGPTLRSLVEVLDRVIGRGVVVDSDLPVSPALAGLRRQAAAAEELPESLPEAAAARELAAEGERDGAREERRDPPRRVDPSD